MEETALALLLVLSVNYQINLKTIPYSTRLIKVDRVGFEPTTSAMPATFYLRAAIER